MTSDDGAIVLIGCRYSGKTTIGRFIAASMGREFVDLDRLIEDREGESVAEIFARVGEAAFRISESRALADLGTGRLRIIATGGGTPVDAGNRRKLRALGFVVYLHLSLETLIHRRADSADFRPPLTSAHADDEQRSILSLRDPLYRACADVVICADASVSEVTERVRAAFESPSLRGIPSPRASGNSGR